ncbi:MAG: MBOAT family protein, partial [Candidatus Marinimicrobia bacterium]|nr:MBOAT family protein [Candidatus Neomarinimicrobiota bacterium]
FSAMRGAATTLILVLGLVLAEWFGREQEFALAAFGPRWKRPVRYALYYALILAIFWFGIQGQQFIYFQF